MIPTRQANYGMILRGKIYWCILGGVTTYLENKLTGIRGTRVTDQGSNWLQGGPVMNGERHTDKGHAEDSGMESFPRPFCRPQEHW